MKKYKTVIWLASLKILLLSNNNSDCSVFDPGMNMAAHVSKAVKSANYYLRNIGRIRK